MQTRNNPSRLTRLLLQIGPGIVLGLLQLLLYMSGLSRFGTNLALNASFWPGLALYAVFGMLAGILTTGRSERPLAGATAAFVMGCIATAVVLLVIISALVLNPPHPAPSSRYYPGLVSIVISIFIFLVLFLNAVGTLFAMLGGAAGRAIGRWWVKRVTPDK
ncbi:MAG TPA: hypothetical protein VKV20_07580 [Ktedonobacteraceae bacterium]|jgi:hypothetical protein|nr:hypothetical protein [Ktedonobacteraceae bacterium]